MKTFPREAKRNIIKDSVKQAKQLTKQKDGPGSSKDSVNAIYELNIFVGKGDVLQFPVSIAHCVSSDFQIAKGFCLLLNPLLTTQSDFGSKSMQV